MKHVTVVGAICCYFYPVATYQYHSSLSRSTTEHRPLVDHTLRAIDPPSQAWYNTEVPRDDGPSPSGKAPGFGPGIRGFESLRPSQAIIVTSLLSAGNFLSRLYLGYLFDHAPTRVLPILYVSALQFFIFLVDQS